MTISAYYKIAIFVSFIFCFNTLNQTIKKTYKSCTSISSSKHNQCVISSKNKKSFCNDEVEIYINQDTYYSNKKLVTISPGGFKGFYILGVLTYIKENYKTDNLIFSGASAGAWNSLFMCYKGEPLEFAYKFMDINMRKAKTISELQYFMKYKLLSSYNTNDFELKNLFIGVTTFNKFIPNINIYSDFDDLDDAINCCMASSHIPLVTGGLSNRYKDMFAFDGGLSSYPYLNRDRILHISFSMWDEINNKNNGNFVKQQIKTIKKFADFFSISKNNILELFDNGYNDAKLHKNYFDEILDSKIIEDTPEF